MNTENQQRTASHAQINDLSHPPEPDLYNLPGKISPEVRDAIDFHKKMPKATGFEPLSFTTPDGWKLATCQTGGNVDIDGRFERTRWDHPFYSDIVVESPKGEDVYKARAAENSPFHVGSRYVAYVRACQHISECRGPPTPVNTQLKNLATRNLTLKTKRRKIEALIDRWSETYPTETIRDQIHRTLRRTDNYYTLRQLQQSEYIDKHTRSWKTTIGTPPQQ